MDLLLPLAAGLGTALLSWRAERTPLAAWIAHAPLALATTWGPAEAAVAALIAGALTSVRAVQPFTHLVPLAAIPPALAAAPVAALVAVVVVRVGPWALLLGAPLVALAMVAPLRLAGAPRWVSSPLACTQERWRTVVFTSRGTELVPTVLLALGGATCVLALLAPLAAAAGAVILALALALADRARRRAERAIDLQPRVRVAAVVADAPAEGFAGLAPLEAAAYRDVEAAITRYAPLVARAAAEGAVLIALPEVAVHVDAAGLSRWEEAGERWAEEHGVAIVLPAFDASAPVNQLALIDAGGVRARHDKRHPARGIEPPVRRRAPPPVVEVAGLEVAPVICVDLDYDDLLPSARRADLLVAPSNDWWGGFEERHHRTAVWAAVRSGTTVLRATGHGISSAIDGAGRLIARASSEHGPVVLVVDAPIGRTDQARRGVSSDSSGRSASSAMRSSVRPTRSWGVRPFVRRTAST